LTVYHIRQDEPQAKFFRKQRFLDFLQIGLQASDASCSKSIFQRCLSFGGNFANINTKLLQKPLAG